MLVQAHSRTPETLVICRLSGGGASSLSVYSYLWCLLPWLDSGMFRVPALEADMLFMVFYGQATQVWNKKENHVWWVSCKWYLVKNDGLFFFLLLLFAEGTSGGRNDCHFISLFIIDAFPLLFIYLFIFFKNPFENILNSPIHFGTT